MAIPFGFAVLIETRDDRARLRARDTGSLFRCRSHAGEGHVVVDIRRLVTDVATVGEVGAALQLRDAGDLPSVDSPVHEMVGMDQRSKVNRVRCVEQVSAIRGLRAIVRTEAERVSCRAK